MCEIWEWAQFPNNVARNSMETFQTFKWSRWDCNVCGRCRKLTEVNYVRLLGRGVDLLLGV